MASKTKTWGKKGFIYFVEIALSVLILMYIFTGFIESEQRAFEQKQLENLRTQGWGALDILHEFGMLDDSVRVNNWSKIDIYLNNSFLNTIEYDLELYSKSLCYTINGGTIITGATYCKSINASTEKDITSVYYTIQDNYSTSSIKIYLWSKL